MFFDPDITLALRDALPWAGEFFKLITEFGSEVFYIGLILIAYWTFNKREAIVVTFVLLFAVASNYLLKTAIANPRPDQTYWYEGMEANNYSTPSGHAQLSGTLYSWFTVRVKTWWALLISAVLIFLIGVSRVYLGVHYLGDVLIGWSVGIATALVLYYLQEPIETTLSKFNEEYLYCALFIAGLALTAIMTYLTPLPPNDNFGAIGGLIMGMAIGLPLEKRFVDFDVTPRNGQRWRLVIRALLGVILVILLLFGLALVMPSVNVWLRTLRYLIVVVVGVFVWPLLFTKANL